MKGKQAIIDKIISDARQIAKSTHEEGVQKAQEIIDAAENDARIYRAKNREESEKEREDIIRRRITAANLEVKKILLKAKQEIISKAFSQSVEEIRKDKKAYKNMLLGMLEHASNGDTLIISKNDKDILTPQDVKYFCQKRKIDISIDTNYGDFLGGLILCGKGWDKNFTLEVELNSLRDELEPQIAQMLFGDN